MSSTHPVNMSATATGSATSFSSSSLSSARSAAAAATGGGGGGIGGSSGGGERRVDAVIFDLGGVVLQPGPLPAIRAYERTTGLPLYSLSRVFAAGGDSGPFARLERGEISPEAFYEPFEAAAREQGLNIDARALFHAMAGELRPDPRMVRAIECLRAEGVAVAAVTNTWPAGPNLPSPLGKVEDLRALFDVFVDSAAVGMRKPEQRIYEHALEQLGVAADKTVMLDDLGTNLKPARGLGMSTIKVTAVDSSSSSSSTTTATTPHDGVDVALADLSAITGFDVRGYAPGTEVPRRKEFSHTSLYNYLVSHCGVTPTANGANDLVLREFSHGQSNPTYYVRCGTRQLVLRKKPPGALVSKTAHAVEREYAVTRALSAYGVPVAGGAHLCEDASVLGTPFYIMDYVAGDVHTNPSLPGLSPSQRTAAYRNMVGVLARIHGIDVKSAGLSDYGGTAEAGYVQRQLDRWSRQYGKTRDVFSVPALETLAAWLPNNVPQASRTSVIHGDFRLDNLILDPGTMDVRAVLDWELSTLGDPWCDLAQNCLTYHFAGSVPPLMGLADAGDLSELGIPTEAELVAQYCAAAGRADLLRTRRGRRQWDAYMAFSCYRVAAILQGVYVRAQQGQAANKSARAVGSLSNFVAEMGLWLAHGRPQDWAPGAHPDGTPPPPADHPQRVISLSPGMQPEERAAAFSDIKEAVQVFVDEHVLPNEHVFEEAAMREGAAKWEIHPLNGVLKEKAKASGLWNLFLPLESDPGQKYGAGLTNAEYAEVCETTGWSVWAPELLNCGAPDTGNMEVLVRYGTDVQKEKWLTPLLNGETRSCFSMTEPAVASSDATNIESRIIPDGNDHYIISGRKWWISGAMDPRCAFTIFMGKTDPSAPRHKQQSMIIVPMDAPGLTVVRPMHVFGYEDAPHGHAEIVFDNVRVPAENLLLGEGRGFEIAQGRLGPGRIHHCMRLIGMAERALELMCRRAHDRVAFGTPLAQKGSVMADVAASRMEIDQCRLLTMEAARLMDTVGNKAARKEIAMIKVVAPQMAQRVLDRAMQVHGAGGLSQDTPLAQLFAWARILRLADGPDEVHRDAIARLELAKYAQKKPPRAKL